MRLPCCVNNDRRQKHHHARGTDPTKPCSSDNTNDRFVHDRSTTRSVCKKQKALNGQSEAACPYHP